MGLSAKLYAGFSAVLLVFLALGAFLHRKLETVANRDRTNSGKPRRTAV
jgi:hypothetical protein